MNTPGKWLARAGALLVIVGFVLPSLMVSCALAPGAGQSITLAQLAGFGNQILYLVPLGVLVILILSFIPVASRSGAMQFLISQVIGLAVSILSILISLISVSSQINQFQGFQTSPDIGLFVLVAGYALCIAGLVFQRRELDEIFSISHYPVRTQGSYATPNAAYPEALAPPIAPVLTGARLEVLSGNLPYSIISINTDNFTIGRSSENNLRVPDTTVSRHHARIRYAQNAWYLQDWESKGGTFINGRQITASRLNTGDQITIGETTFVFRM